MKTTEKGRAAHRTPLEALKMLTAALHTMANGGMDYPGHKATVGQFKRKLRALRNEAEDAIRAAEGE